MSEAFDPWELVEGNGEDEPRGRKGKRQGSYHPILGELRGGASDAKGHRTTISIPQELSDRMAVWQAKLHGTPFDSHQGMIRHAVHMLMDALGEAEEKDATITPELAVWIRLSEATAIAEQDARFQGEIKRLVETYKGTLDDVMASGDAERLELSIRQAERSLELLPPVSARALEDALVNYRAQLERMK